MALIQQKRRELATLEASFQRQFGFGGDREGEGDESSDQGLLATMELEQMLLLGDEDEDDEDRLGTPPLPDPQGAEEEEEEDGADLGAGDDIDTGEAGDGGMVGAEDLATLIFHPATDTYYDPETGKHYAADLAAGDG